jgi:substrate import-associated zinc metallohydrolase lipoprotein
LGSANNGYSITLYTVNQFDLAKGVNKTDLNEFFRTMHHEFGHVLNQRKPYDPNFQSITGNYTADWTTLTNAQARELGFISAYARSADTEDFVEILAYYVVNTDNEWQALINAIKSTQAKEYIRLKVQYVSSYMKSAYGVDLLELRAEITKAITEVVAGNLEVN